MKKTKKYLLLAIMLVLLILFGIQRIVYKQQYKINSYSLAIFVDGEFWHGYEWGEKKKKLKRNREYWIAKIEENIARDVRVDKELMALGWIPIHFWTKEVIKNTNDCVKAVSELAFDIMLQEPDE